MQNSVQFHARCGNENETRVYLGQDDDKYLLSLSCHAGLIQVRVSRDDLLSLLLGPPGDPFSDVIVRGPSVRGQTVTLERIVAGTSVYLVFRVDGAAVQLSELRDRIMEWLRYH